MVLSLDMEKPVKDTDKKGSLPSYEEAIVAPSAKPNDQVMYTQPPPNPYAQPSQTQPVVQQLPGQVGLKSSYKILSKLSGYVYSSSDAECSVCDWLWKKSSSVCLSSLPTDYCYCS